MFPLFDPLEGNDPMTMSPVLENITVAQLQRYLEAGNEYGFTQCVGALGAGAGERVDAATQTLADAFGEMDRARLRFAKRLESARVHVAQQGSVWGRCGCWLSRHRSPVEVAVVEVCAALDEVDQVRSCCARAAAARVGLNAAVQELVDTLATLATVETACDLADPLVAEVVRRRLDVEALLVAARQAQAVAGQRPAMGDVLDGLYVQVEGVLLDAQSASVRPLGAFGVARPLVARKLVPAAVAA